MNSLRGWMVGWVAAAVVAGISGTAPTAWAQPAATPPAGPAAPANPPLVREIFVPFGDLQVLLESAPQRVFLARDEYERLVQAARKSPSDPAPREASLIAAGYDVEVGDGRAKITGALEVEVLEPGVHALALAWSGVGVRAARLDGQPAPLGDDGKGQWFVFVKDRGRKRLELDLVAPLETTAALQSMAAKLPLAPATRMRLTVPGNVEIKSGAAVIQRALDEGANVTKFELLPSRGGEPLVMTLNNRQLLRDRVVMARSVLIDEVTQGYERLHGNLTFGVLHGAVDRFRLRVPAGFDVTEVKTPLLARWGLEPVAKDANPAAGAVLEIQLREPATSAEPVTVQLVAARPGRPPEAWTFPAIEPLDTAAHVAVWGLLAEDRWKVDGIETTGLLPIDATTLAKALPASVQTADPTAPPVLALAAFYAPQAGSRWTARLRQPAASFRTTANVLLLVGQKQWEVSGGFAIVPEVDKVFGVDIAVPTGWLLTQATTADGHLLPIEVFPTDKGGQRVQVRIPGGLAPQVPSQIYFRAEASPKGWLDVWPEKRFPIDFPVFSAIGAAQSDGAIAIRAGDDLRLAPADAARFQALTPLDENEKKQYGLEGTPTDFAYRHDAADYSAAFVAEPIEPTVTARTFSFLKLDADSLAAHYEIAYQIQGGRTQELTLVLPSSTPATLAIRGLDGAVVKEFGVVEAAAKPDGGPAAADATRRWRVVLSDRTTGRVRLAVDFQQNLPSSQPKGWQLPLVAAEPGTVNYQSGLVAVEGTGELDVQLHVDGDGPGRPRKVDVGELAEADYVVGRRVLGAYGFVGEIPVVTVDIDRRAAIALSAAIAQRAELITLIGPAGRALTAARFQLRSKASFLELRMPSDAMLWSALLDQKALAPQRNDDRLLLSMPAGSEETLRDVQLVYESPVASLAMRGTLAAEAPRLFLREDSGADAQEVPLADVQWKVLLPSGYRLTHSAGTVFPDWDDPITRDQLAMRPPPWTALAQNVDRASGWASDRLSPLSRYKQALSTQLALANHSAKYSRAKRAAQEATPYALLADGTASMMSARPEDFSGGMGGLGGGGAMAPGGGGFGVMPGAGSGPGMSGGAMPGGMGGAGMMPGAGRPGIAGKPAPAALPPMAGPPNRAKDDPFSDTAPAPKSEAPPPPTAEPVPVPQAKETPASRDAASKSGEATVNEPAKPAPAATEGREEREKLADELAAPQEGKATSAKGGAALSDFSSLTDFWALQGVRSLPFDFSPYLTVATDRVVTFRSLGNDPKLEVTLVDQRRWTALAWALALALALRGLMDTSGPVGRKTRRVMLGLLLASLLPVVAPWHQELSTLADPLFTVSALLGVWYLAVGFTRWCGGRLKSWSERRRRLAATRSIAAASSTPVDVPAAAPASGSTTASLVLFALLCLGCSGSWAQAPPEENEKESRRPVVVPADAIIIPYHPDTPNATAEAKKVLVPYDKYVELWNLAHPDQRLEVKAPPAPYGWAGVVYDATLDNSNDLLLDGRLTLEVLTGDQVDVPLPLVGGVLTAARIDGQPAQLRFVQPVAPAPQPQAANAPPAQAPAVPPPAAGMLALTVSGRGRKQVELQFRMKLERRGGWRVAEGRLPSGPSAALNLRVTSTGTEVRIGAVADRGRYETSADNQRLETALGPAGELNLQWRPKVAAGEVDRGLAVESSAELDVREDALRVVWQLALQFPRARRDGFTFAVPGEYLVERVVGDNVRGWQAGADGAQQKVDVTLLKTAVDQERVTLILSRRGRIGRDPLTRLALPSVAVTDAVLHQGTIAVRRSPALDVHLEELKGLSPAERPEQSLSQAAGLVEESPLGVRPLQTLRYKTPAFAAVIVATSVPENVSAELRSLLKIEERRAFWESQMVLRVPDRPLHQVRVRLPAGLKLTDVRAPGAVQWAVASDQGRQLLTILLQNGLRGEGSVLVRGRIDRAAGQGMAIPQVELLDVTRQEGTLVIQVDPSVDVRAENLQGCEPVLMSRTNAWLAEAQRASARLALLHRTTDYSGNLQLTRREPRVSCFTVTNMRLSNRSIEETVMLEFRIEEAGIREVSFQLPAALREARISAPLLRRKIVAPVEQDATRVRVKLELQDEVMGQFRVLVESDRLLTGDSQRAPIPTVETGRTDQRFVTLETSGRDEVLFDQQEGVEPLTRQQQAWARLAALFGDHILAAFQVRADANQPTLAYHTRTRATYETVQARIALAQTDLEVDASGTYRGRQTYQVDNGTEQYLVVELPKGATLWTAQVAGESVRPQEVPNSTSDRSVRIPLVKTAQGDLDYPVVLTYGGQLPEPSFLSTVRFPFLKTVNINVELSRVRLLLPPTQRWFDFGGSLGRVDERGEYEASGLEYQIKRLTRLSEVLRGPANDDLTKLRATNNLKLLGSQLQITAAQSYSNSEFQRNFNVLNSVIDQTREQVQAEEKAQQLAESQESDGNRGRLNAFFFQQENKRARNVVAELGDNFDAGAPPPEVPRPDDAGAFNGRWFDANQLGKKLETGRVNMSDPAKAQAAAKGQGGGRLGREANPSQQEVRRTLEHAQQGGAGQKAKAGEAEAADAKSRSDSRKQSAEQAGTNLNRRYQERLEAQQQLQQLDLDANGAANELFRRGRSSGVKAQSETSKPVVLGGAANAPSTAPEGRLIPDSAAAPVDRKPAFPVADLVVDGAARGYLAGVKVDLPGRGTEFLFKTPRGDLELTARSVPAPVLTRVWRLAVVIVVLLPAWLIVRLTRRTTASRPSPLG